MAEYIEKKVFKINATLREVISGVIFYHPWWLKVLYKVRGILAKILKLKHENTKLQVKKPEEISFKSGDFISFFMVIKAKEEKYWVATAPDDKHLKVLFCIKQKNDIGNLKEFHLLTIVKYLHWTGPVYFNMIKPFHQLILYMMLRSLKKKYLFRNKE